MAIKSLSNDSEGFQIEINNGDLKALNDVVEKWGFKDKESAIRFCIAVLSLTEAGSLYVDKDGNKAALKPQDSLMRSEKSG